MDQPRDALAFLATMVHLNVEGAAAAFRQEIAKTSDVEFRDTILDPPPKPPKPVDAPKRIPVVPQHAVEEKQEYDGI